MKTNVERERERERVNTRNNAPPYSRPPRLPAPPSFVCVLPPRAARVNTLESARTEWVSPPLK